MRTVSQARDQGAEVHDVAQSTFPEAFPRCRSCHLRGDGRTWFLSDPVHSEPRNRIGDRKSTRLNSSHITISYAVFCLKKKRKKNKKLDRTAQKLKHRKEDHRG